MVRDATTGETLYDRNGSTRLLPASNTKLFSSTAAMHTLGAGFRFHTDVLATAPVRDGKLRGNLYLKGYGDPTALESDYVALAKQVATSGVRRIDGDLIADDTYFDKVRLGDSWAWDDEPFYYSAQISALTLAPNTDYDSGTAIVESLPGATVGAPVKLKLVPANGVLKLVNTATTGAAGSSNTLYDRARPRHQHRPGDRLGPRRRHARPGMGDRLGAGHVRRRRVPPRPRRRGHPGRRAHPHRGRLRPARDNWPGTSR